MRQFILAATVAVVAAICLPSGTLSAQETGRIQIQAGPIYNIPSGSFAASDGSVTGLPSTGFATGGFGYGARLLIPFSPAFSFYVELTRPGFGTDVDAILTALGLPTDLGFDVDFRWRIRATGVGIRLDVPLESRIRPYLQAGMARYRGELEVVQDVYESTEQLDVSNSANFGGGVTVPLGPVVLDAGARYHSVRFEAGGQTFGWPAQWIEAGVKLALDIRF